MTLHCTLNLWINLRFYNRNLDIKVDNGGFNEYVVFAYGKNTDGTEPLGGWPGRMMQKSSRYGT